MISSPLRLTAFLLLACTALPAAAGGAPEKPVRTERREVYIVQMEGAPLALYRGGVAGLAPTHPGSRGERRLDAASPDSRRYLEHLSRRQDEVLGGIRRGIGRDVKAVRRYVNALNGVALELGREEADLISRLPGVKRVERGRALQPLSDAGPGWIGAPGIWDGTQTGGLPGTKGEGMVIGIIDTGINMDHPSFADLGGDGYDHTNPRGAGNYVGWCNPSNPDYDPSLPCNDKLIGAWSYSSWSDSPEDFHGHGTLLASLAAGNHVNLQLTAGLSRPVAGVAPHANLIAYDVCEDDYLYCSSWAVVAAVDQAVVDGVDVLNLSLGGGSYSTPWEDSLGQALLAAREAGVFAAVAAGNSGYYGFGSTPSTPWLLAVGASTHHRRFMTSLTGMSGGGSPPPSTLAGEGLTSAFGPAPLVYAGDYGDSGCDSPFPAGTFSGQIVLCQSWLAGDGSLEAEHVKAGGGGAVVLWNYWDDPIQPRDLGIPALWLDDSEGYMLSSWLASGTGHTAQITATAVVGDLATGDLVPDFSGRGPGTVPDVLRPDLVAPGVEILGASKDPEDLTLREGTSLASASAAGAAALLLDLHPDWTPAEVQSAMMTTAKATGLKDEGGSPLTDPHAIGAGRLDLGAAGRAGLVLDETAAGFEQADPDLGGLPQNLNLASLAASRCVLGCSWTRTFRSTLSTDSHWTAVLLAPPGTTGTVTPSSFTLAPGETKTVQIQLSGPPPEYGWSAGSLTFTEAGSQAPPARLPIATRWIPRHKLAVTKMGTGAGTMTSSPAGIDCGPTCSALFPEGTQITLTATPAAGSAFVGWDGWPCYSTANSCTLYVDYDEFVTAYFDLQPADRPLSNRSGFKDSMNPPVGNGTWRYYYVDLGAGNDQLVVDLLDLTGDATLYVRHADKPTWSAYNCLDYDYYNLPNRRCAVTAPAAGRWWIGVNNEQTGLIQYTVRASWGSQADHALANGVPVGGFVSSEAPGEAWKYYYVDLAGETSELIVDLADLSADADLFVRFGAKPDRSNYHCVSARTGADDERCTLPQPEPGRWWIAVNNFSAGTVTYTARAAWSAAAGADFHTVEPCRLVDTRQSYALQARQPRSFLAAGHCGIPATARAVALTVTVVGATTGGNVTLYPDNLSVPLASTINFQAGQTRANNAIARLGTDGEGRIGAFAALGDGGIVHLILDVTGYFE